MAVSDPPSSSCNSCAKRRAVDSWVSSMRKETRLSSPVCDFHLAEHARRDAHGDDGADQRDHEASAQQEFRFLGEMLGLAIDASGAFRRRGRSCESTSVRHGSGDLLMAGEQIARGVSRARLRRSEACALPAKNRAWRAPDRSSRLRRRPPRSLGHQLADFLVGLIQIGQNVLAVDDRARVRKTVKGGVENVLFALHFIEQLDDDQLILTRLARWRR